MTPTLQDPEWLAHIQAVAARSDYEYISQQISDDLLDRFALAGNPKDIIRQVEKLIEAGTNRVEFGTPHGLNSAEGIRRLESRFYLTFTRRLSIFFIGLRVNTFYFGED